MNHENPITEIWRIRDELGAQEGYDVRQLFERLRREEKKHSNRLVRMAPHGAPEESIVALREEPPKND